MSIPYSSSSGDRFAVSVDRSLSSIVIFWNFSPVFQNKRLQNLQPVIYYFVMGMLVSTNTMIAILYWSIGKFCYLVPKLIALFTARLPRVVLYLQLCVQMSPNWISRPLATLYRPFLDESYERRTERWFMLFLTASRVVLIIDTELMVRRNADIV